MKFIRHSPFFHEYDFPVSKVLEKYKDELIEVYETSSLENSYNVPLKCKELYNYLEPNFYKLIQYWYNVPPPIVPYDMMLYIQTNKTFSKESPPELAWHTHVNQGVKKTCLNATLYLHNLKENEGGEFEMVLPPDKPITIRTKKDKIYFFPNWLLHRPLPQTSSEPRICFNWGYITDKKFIHRASGDAW